MKILLASIALFLSLPLHAQYGGPTNVREVANSTNTITQTISLCNVSGTPAVTDVANATSSGTLQGSWGIEVANLAASTSTLNCGFDLMLSTDAGNAWYGREITAGSSIIWQVGSWRKLYCLTQNNNGCTRATITQVK